RRRSRLGVRRSVSMSKPPAMTEQLRHEAARPIEPAHEAQARPLPGTKKIAILLVALAERAQRAPLRARERGRAGGGRCLCCHWSSPQTTARRSGSWADRRLRVDRHALVLLTYTGVRYSCGHQ